MTSILLIAATERELCPPPAPAAALRALCCGIGPVEASLATAHALTAGEIGAVLHVGIAGAPALPPGTVVLGEESIYSDIIDPNATMPRVVRLRPSPALLAAARRSLPDAAVLPIATTGRVGGGLDQPVEAMEGFGVLRAAALANVPALELRVISNAPEDPDRSHWRIDDALQVLHQAIREVVPALLEASR